MIISSQIKPQFSTLIHYLCHSLERRINFVPGKGECLRAEASGCPFREPWNLISQPSTFFGTQTSKRNWPRTLCALMPGGLESGDVLSFGSGEEGCSPTSWESAELGKKKWSLGPTATLLKLWFELTAAFWRSHINSGISSPSMLLLSPLNCRILWE